MGSLELPVSVFAFLEAGSAPADDPGASPAPLLSSGAFFFLPNTPWTEREGGEKGGRERGREREGERERGRFSVCLRFRGLSFRFRGLSMTEILI